MTQESGRRSMRAVSSLPVRVLHEVIQQQGLEACAPMMALATKEQLAGVFDVDLWTPARAGGDDRFDAERFGTWLEVMVDAGESAAAAMLSKTDRDLAAAGLVHFVRVFDGGVVASHLTLDGEWVQPYGLPAEQPTFDIDGYVLVSVRARCWEAITTALAALAASDRDCFHDLMRACRRLSSSRPEVDGLDDLMSVQQQVTHDLALSREERRDDRGYVPPAQARLFLETSRRPARAAAVQENGLVRVEGEGSVHGRAYLANVLMAGGAIQGRAMTPQEAADAVDAVCALGAENRAPHASDRDALLANDLVGVFQTGWRVLFEDVCMFTADRLVQMLLALPRNHLDPDTRYGLERLRIELTNALRVGTPWIARDALDVLAVLDLPTSVAVLGLIDELPLLHAFITASARGDVRHVIPSEFSFISTNDHIADIHAFVESLPDRLGDGRPQERTTKGTKITPRRTRS